MAAITPKVVLFSHDLETLQRSGQAVGTGIARLLDEQDGVPEVVHLFPSGAATGLSEPHTVLLDWHLNDRNKQEDRSVEPPRASVWIDTDSALANAGCALYLDADHRYDCPVEIVQTGARAFTRNAPVLETDVLSGKSVLCVGLGSGGSAIVDQLARSGIGHFVLWDMDRLESHNVGRHTCTLRDLGRRKVLAVRDHIRAINPAARVDVVHKDVLQCVAPGSDLDRTVAEADCVIVGTDNNASRYAVNETAWRHRKTALYGRAFTRASGGDVIQVVPPDMPCYACHTAGRVVDEEVSSTRDATRVAYADLDVPIEPGLIIDIQPIANMIARLCVLRLCESHESGLKTLASEMAAPLYLWANRREGQFSSWRPMERSFDRLAILRWYAIGVPKDTECPVCGNFGAT